MRLSYPTYHQKQTYPKMKVSVCYRGREMSEAAVILCRILAQYIMLDLIPFPYVCSP